MGTLTVREAVMFSAQLRLPQAMSMVSKQQRVELILKELGLERIVNSRIGTSETRGISGGEKKRVSIAQELVTSPSILCLDEPTSGLDSHSAQIVVECLAGLAHTDRRTVICTIHQPRSNIFQMFDKVLLLSHGEMVRRTVTYGNISLT